MSAELIVGEDAEGKTLAAFLRAELGELSWNQAKRLCTTGKVHLDGERSLDPAVRLEAGSRVQVDWRAPKPRGGVLEPERLVHVDRDVVVVRKPAGTLSIPYDPRDRDTLIDQTRALLRRRDRRKGGHRYDPELGIVHRLDKGTSGLLVFTRTVAAKRALAQQFRKHTVERVYLAIVHGHTESATHESWLVPNRGDGLRGSWGVFLPARGKRPTEARRAVTHVDVVEHLPGATLVECRLETGRQHQIRIHMSEDAHPLVGEDVYIRDYEGEPIDAPRPMLHARTLGFEHPRTGEQLRFDDPPPQDFETVLRALRAQRA